MKVRLVKVICLVQFIHIQNLIFLQILIVSIIAVQIVARDVLILAIAVYWDAVLVIIVAVMIIDAVTQPQLVNHGKLVMKPVVVLEETGVIAKKNIVKGGAGKILLFMMGWRVAAPRVMVIG